MIIFQAFISFSRLCSFRLSLMRQENYLLPVVLLAPSAGLSTILRIQTDYLML